MNVRLSSVLGAAAVLAGLAMVFAQRLAQGLSLQWALVLLVAALAMVQALRFVQGRRTVELRETETGDPELRYEAPTPGDDVAETLAATRRWSRRGRNAQTQLRERVGEAAIVAVMDERGCSREAAYERVRSGEWTDDPIAASFLSREVALTPRERAQLLVAARSPLSRYQAAFARAVRAVAERSGADVVPEPEEAES